jgi:hypothetical protein
LEIDLVKTILEEWVLACPADDPLELVLMLVQDTMEDIRVILEAATSSCLEYPLERDSKVPSLTKRWQKKDILEGAWSETELASQWRLAVCIPAGGFENRCLPLRPLFHGSTGHGRDHWLIRLVVWF